MAKAEFHVIGAGPAGAAFAYFAGLKGYKVNVYEMLPAPGLKPCGWAVPRKVNEILKIPSEFILTEIRGVRVYLDGRLVGERREGGVWGYIVNKPLLIRYLLEQAERVEYRVRACVGRQGLVIGSMLKAESSSVVVAAGNLWSGAPRDRIYAVQVLLEFDKKLEDSDVVEIWFDSRMVGYYWFFPEGEKRARVGVGGYEEPQSLLERLERFLSEHPKAKLGTRIEPVRGSHIVVSGPQQHLMDGIPPVIGEAAGLVYPISGEGIRPALESGKKLLEALESGKPLSKLMEKTVSVMKRQKKLLDIVKRAPPRLRAAVLEKLPIEATIALALGDADPLTVVRRVLSRLPLTG